jgi:UDP-N-acetylmuramoyl-tripeptide--D-alanyl-D-alanine ligase
MIPLTLAEIARIVDGRLDGGADPAAIVDQPLSFDSRDIFTGGLFLAIRGEHVDGHDYVTQALAAGAVAAIVTWPVGVPSIVVGDPYTALADLARAVVRRLPHTTVIGITGSSGKTSTKDLIAQLLERLGPTVAPPGSFNNELGHPYTVLLANERTRFLVLENSARGLGHIRYLTRVAPPRIAAVLNVGSAHLGEFGSRTAIAAAKGEIVEDLPDASSGGVAILNAEDPLVASMAARTRARVVTFGRSAVEDVWADGERLDALGRAAFTIHARATEAKATEAEVTLRLSGSHQVDNALAAAAVALECGLTLGDVAAELSRAVPKSRWRMEITTRPDGVVIINDAYNANPQSMRAALETVAGIRREAGSRTIAVLGPMAELGADTEAEHRAVGRDAARLGIARLVTVGDQARSIAQGAALEGSWNGTSVCVADTADAVDLLRAELRPGDVVLVKASRAASLERVALSLTEDVPPDRLRKAAEGSSG